MCSAVSQCIVIILPVVRWPRNIDMECTVVWIKISSRWLCSDEEMSTAERRQTKLELTLLLSLEEREEKEEVQAVENRWPRFHTTIFRIHLGCCWFTSSSAAAAQSGPFIALGPKTKTHRQLRLLESEIAGDGFPRFNRGKGRDSLCCRHWTNIHNTAVECTYKTPLAIILPNSPAHWQFRTAYRYYLTLSYHSW